MLVCSTVPRRITASSFAKMGPVNASTHLLIKLNVKTGAEINVSAKYC